MKSVIGRHISFFFLQKVLFTLKNIVTYKDYTRKMLGTPKHRKFRFDFLGHRTSLQAAFQFVD